LSFNANKLGLSGFQEVVFSVRDLQKSMLMYKDLGGWELIDESEVSKDCLDFWNLPSTCTAQTCLLKYPEKDSGMIRLISFKQVAQVHIRDSAQSWDTGGIYDVDLRVSDIYDRKEAFQSYGWSGFSMEEEYHFENFHVSEILLRGHEDIVFALIQRHAPALEGFDQLHKMSHVFNSSQIVKDMDRSKAFYLDQLGFQIYMEVNQADGECGPNIFGVPYNIWPTLNRKITIISPDGTNKGSVELVQLEGVEGKDFSHYAIPPNLGILMLRFPVHNLDRYLDAFKTAGGLIHIPAQEVTLNPYGKIRQAVIISPDGAWLEFYESLNRA